MADSFASADFRVQFGRTWFSPRHLPACGGRLSLNPGHVELSTVVKGISGFGSCTWYCP